jgi:TPR repeat protein
LKTLHLLIFCFLFVVLSLSEAFSQDTTQSLAFRNNKPRRTSPYFYRPDLSYQIWQQFKLRQEANAGDPLAQHELGLRYLMGDGIPVDTVQAIYWIKRAADQNLTTAKYNYAIFLINGIGLEWNPFVAFKYFKSAADDGMVQAQYVVGVLYTDNLITKRNWNLAYYWIKKSADGEYEPAADVLDQLKPRISQSVVDSLFRTDYKNQDDERKPVSDPDKNLTTSLGLVFIDFDALRDTVYEITDSMLVADIDIIGVDSLKEKLGIDSTSTLTSLASTEYVVLLSQLAENGSPEAQVILGRLYQNGSYFNENIITAASYYYRALRNDSPKATHILWQLSQSEEFKQRVQQEVDKDNTLAKYLWYGLTSIGFDNRIALSDALNLLEEAGNENYVPAIIELGLNYYRGRFSERNEEAGLELWRNAERTGNLEARVRLAAARLFDSFMFEEYKNDFQTLVDASKNGSLLAMVSLAICYEKGIGTDSSKPDAVNYYRLASQRGSQFAYQELQRLYDEMRPNDPEFLIIN